MGGNHQERVILVMFIFCQVVGVARRHRFGIAKTGLDVREGDLWHLVLQGRSHLCPNMGAVLHVWGGTGREERMGEAGRCPRERPGPIPEVAREDRVATGEVIAESRPMGAGEEPWPAVAEAVGRIAEMEFLVVADPDSDSVVGPGGARGCTTIEGNSQGGVG